MGEIIVDSNPKSIFGKILHNDYDSKENRIEWAAFAVVLLVAHALGFLQAPMSVNDGLGWDGFQYYLMAEQAMAGQEFKSPPVRLQATTTDARRFFCRLIG